MLKNTEEKDLFSYSLIQAHEISVVNFLFTEKNSVINSLLSLFEPMHDMSHSFGAMQSRNLSSSEKVIVDADKRSKTLSVRARSCHYAQGTKARGFFCNSTTALDNNLITFQVSSCEK